MPLYGKIADIHGRRSTLCIAIAIHIAGSLICALAPSMVVLILGRALQGIGGAGLTSIPIVVLGDVAAPKERGRYYGLFLPSSTPPPAPAGRRSAASSSDSLHWSAIFWLNIPLDLIALCDHLDAAAAAAALRAPAPARPDRRDPDRGGERVVHAGAQPRRRALSPGRRRRCSLLFAAALGSAPACSSGDCSPRPSR